MSFAIPFVDFAWNGFRMFFWQQLSGLFHRVTQRISKHLEEYTQPLHNFVPPRLCRKNSQKTILPSVGVSTDPKRNDPNRYLKSIIKKGTSLIEMPSLVISWMRMCTLFAFSHLLIFKSPKYFFLLFSFQIFCRPFKVLSSCHDYQYLSFDTHRPIYFSVYYASNGRKWITSK